MRINLGNTALAAVLLTAFSEAPPSVPDAPPKT